MAERELELVVARRDEPAKGIVLLTLASKDGSDLPFWEPGAHIDLHFAANDVDYVRQYSLCGPRTDRRHWQVAVLRVPDGRGGSAHIHEGLAAGEIIRVTGPRNNFQLAPAKRYLFIAGGIGITPMLPMIADAAASGADWHLVYCGRSAASMAFIDQVTSFGPDRVSLHESDVQGQADLAALISGSDPEVQIYCCGPESMLRAVEACPSARDRVHLERFSRREDEGTNPNSSFEVEFARSGIVVTVPPDRSILEVAEEFGVDIDSSCQEGVCGSCETKVISGIPDHKDSVLTTKERAAGKCMMVCVSRSCSARLVLDA